MLTIVGMVGGYLLSQRRDRSTSSSSSASEPATAHASPEVSSGPPLLPVEGECTEHTQEMAHEAGASGTLSQVLRITTDIGTVVWICQDQAGNLYYHANQGGEDAKWEEGVTALFIPDMHRQPDGSFQGTAPQDGAIFNLTPERLRIRKKNGSEKVQEAVPN